MTRPVKLCNDCRVAVVQINSNHVLAENLQTLEQLIAEYDKSFDLLMLPENFAHMPRNENERTECAEIFGQGEIQSFLSQLAKKNDCWIVAGSVPLHVSGTVNNKPDKRKIYQASLVYDNQGNFIKRYDKVHLFDVTLPSGEFYQESKYIEFGDSKQNSIVETPWGLLGLSICYDVRFPEFYRAMPDDVFLVSVPAAFTYDSGKAHWDTLLKARAIENQVYIAASAQTGTHSNGRKTWGHSALIDPWGQVAAQAEQNETIISTNIDLAYIKQVREQFPCLQHKRI